MSKVTNINTHKDFDPVYFGISSHVRDRQKLINKSLLEFMDNAIINNEPPPYRDPFPFDRWDK
jgi:hypothetical protein